MAERITKQRVEADSIPDRAVRCMFCRLWDDTGRGICKGCEEAREVAQRTEDRAYCKLLRAYSEETNDPRGRERAERIEDEWKMADRGDFSFLRRSPPRMDFYPEFKRWKENRGS